MKIVPTDCRAFVGAYEEMMKREIHYPPLNQTITYRWLMVQQVKRFKDWLKTAETPYEPFTWEG